jgi:hypothetical protein
MAGGGAWPRTRVAGRAGSDHGMSRRRMYNATAVAIGGRGSAPAPLSWLRTSVPGSPALNRLLEASRRRRALAGGGGTGSTLPAFRSTRRREDAPPASSSIALGRHISAAGTPSTRALHCFFSPCTCAQLMLFLSLLAPAAPSCSFWLMLLLSLYHLLLPYVVPFSL